LRFAAPVNSEVGALEEAELEAEPESEPVPVPVTAAAPLGDSLVEVAAATEEEGVTEAEDEIAVLLVHAETGMLERVVAGAAEVAEAEAEAAEASAEHFGHLVVTNSSVE